MLGLSWLMGKHDMYILQASEMSVCVCREKKGQLWEGASITKQNYHAPMTAQVHVSFCQRKGLLRYRKFTS